MKYIIELEKVEGTDIWATEGPHEKFFSSNEIENLLIPYTKHTDKSCEFCRYESVELGESPCKECKYSYVSKFEAKRVKKVKRYEAYNDMREAHDFFTDWCSSHKTCDVCPIKGGNECSCFADWLMEEVEVEE